MASIQEKLADSLSVLKKYQDENNSDIIQGMKTLGETHTKRLIDNGYLEQVIKGWYMPTMPGMEGDTTVWYASYWKFIVAYSNNVSETTGVLLQMNHLISMPERQ